MTVIAHSTLTALIGLYGTRGVGSRTLTRVVDDVVNSPATRAGLWEMCVGDLVHRYAIKQDVAQGWRMSRERAEQIYEELRERGVLLLVRGTADYPSRVTNVLGNDAPPMLFIRGNRRLLERKAVGFCGSRKASDRGLWVARESARMLAAQGIVVVSGYAHGVDLATHLAAVEAGGATVIVLAEGILRFSRKRAVADALTDTNSAVVSEFPPRMTWSINNAMTRNQTICALSNAMIVVEAGTTGGTIAAGQSAIEHGRPLFVVDFAEPAESAAGNAQLLERGAVALRRRRSGEPSLEDVIRAIDDQYQRNNGTVRETTLFDPDADA